ncbi:hypothetical protein NDU88_007154 [Pleurodeles waltl]|uniref:Uncharacterized protein n=1 Tax=Pleurodeles waltl TaxID=8319 RepID=A0AAV7QN87_PLEWA|nr:hypothetical protein NDU88_007154 [Pleurodeles waltl]
MCGGVERWKREGTGLSEAARTERSRFKLPSLQDQLGAGAEALALPGGGRVRTDPRERASPELPAGQVTGDFSGWVFVSYPWKLLCCSPPEVPTERAREMPFVSGELLWGCLRCFKCPGPRRGEGALHAPPVTLRGGQASPGTERAWLR